jgi:hypothetical protein
MHQNKNGTQPMDKTADIAKSAPFNPFLAHQLNFGSSMLYILKAWDLAV